LLFVVLWLLGGLFVIINSFCNPIASLSSFSQMITVGVSIFQIVILITVWSQFSKGRYSMDDVLRMLGLGVVALPYVIQVGELFYTSLR